MRTSVSDALQLPADVVIGTIFNFRTSTPFSARAGADLNGDGANTHYVPGTTTFGRILTAQPRQQGEVAIRFAW